MAPQAGAAPDAHAESQQPSPSPPSGRGRRSKAAAPTKGCLPGQQQPVVGGAPAQPPGSLAPANSRKSAHRHRGRQRTHGVRPPPPRQWISSAEGFFGRLEANLQCCLLAARPSWAEEEQLLRCILELRNLVCGIGPGWGLELFGSCVNGFGARACDLDATCVDPGGHRLGAQPTACLLEAQLAPRFHLHPGFVVIDEILSAQVPILRLRFEDSVEVDLSCRNLGALVNTRLLRAYAELDSRIRDLGVAVKLWAKAAFVCGAQQHNLSSYSFTLMAIYAMQVHSDVQLPCLPAAAFLASSSGSDAAVAAAVDAARASWICPCSLAELLVLFFGFYSFDFDWGREVVSIRLGSRHDIHDPVFEGLRGRGAQRLHVQDPIQLERNLHCVLGEREEALLRLSMAEAWNVLQLGGPPTGLQPPAAARPVEPEETPWRPPEHKKETNSQQDEDFVDMQPTKKEDTDSTDAPDVEVDFMVEPLRLSSLQSCAGSESPRWISVRDLEKIFCLRAARNEHTADPE